ncbi:hypothetical protein J40TS1_28070 [Paenibacillus montaniterrae]|uniref:Uncharacterized protein n=1 Tax=Paenibacillus montaniterrae TaxID=429341 RepID=A0A920CY98_9BACL|nr:hypothetical protein [Paenibacillus montaniterrae]GIP17165.1 hypothetical protein J40TS1_28070 [Paenibacillus montaniterrae]
MIPFENTLPYDVIMNDYYVQQCPFCNAEHVLLPLKKKEIPDIQSGKKKLLVFPCCYSRLTIVNIDDDYLLADSSVRKQA